MSKGVSQIRLRSHQIHGEEEQYLRNCRLDVESHQAQHIMKQKLEWNQGTAVHPINMITLLINIFFLTMN